MPKAKKLPSGSWRARAFSHVDADGKYVYKSFTAPTKAKAEYLAAEFTARRIKSKGKMTVGDAVDRYIESKSNVLSPTTLYGYLKIRKNNLQSIMGILVDQIDMEIVQKCVNEESEKMSAKTVSNAYGLLRAALLMQRPELVLRIRLPRKKKRLVRDLPPSSAVIKAVRGTPVELPVLLALWLCLRISEVRGIKKTAIHGDLLVIDNVIVPVGRKHIEKSLAKTDASMRAVALPKELKQMILAQPTEYATTLTGKAIYSRFTRLMQKAGYPNVRFHDLRHIAASDMNRLGITDRVAADRGGWATTITMKSIYQHSFSSDREAADYVINRYYESLLEDEDDDKDKSDTKKSEI